MGFGFLEDVQVALLIRGRIFTPSGVPILEDVKVTLLITRGTFTPHVVPISERFEGNSTNYRG